MPPRKSDRVSRKTSRKTSRKSSRKSSRKTSRKTSRKSSRKTSRKTSRKASRKTSRKTSRKASRKTSRKTSGKTSRKTSRKASRKTSRKTSRKDSRKASKKTQNVQNTQIEEENLGDYFNDKAIKGIKASKEAINALGESKQKLFFPDKIFYLIGTIKDVINLSANVLREKHFNRKTQARKINDPEFDKYKVNPLTIYFDRENVKRAFEIILNFLREYPGVVAQYNPYLEIEYDDNKDINYNIYHHMIDKANKEFEDIENEEYEE